MEKFHTPSVSVMIKHFFYTAKDSPKGVSKSSLCEAQTIQEVIKLMCRNFSVTDERDIYEYDILEVVGTNRYKVVKQKFSNSSTENCVDSKAVSCTVNNHQLYNSYREVV